MDGPEQVPSNTIQYAQSPASIRSQKIFRLIKRGTTTLTPQVPHTTPPPTPPHARTQPTGEGGPEQDNAAVSRESSVGMTDTEPDNTQAPSKGAGY